MWERVAKGLGMQRMRGAHHLGSGWPNGAGQASDVLVPGTPAQGAFEGDGGTEIWALSGEAGEVVRIEITSGDLDTAVELVAPSGEVVARSDYRPWGGDAQVVAVLPASGRYEVRVSGAVRRGSGDREGKYNMEARTSEIPSFYHVNQ